MSWVGVRYRRIALPDIMKAMRIWLDQRQFEPETFEYVISGSGTLVRVAFARDAEAAEFAEAFGGLVLRDHPSIERTEENSGERSAPHGL
jgi:hypothetical protein